MLHVILHIGQHKTGSKALQSALYANRSYLAENGCDYSVPADPVGHLRPWQMNHHQLFEAVRVGARAGGGVSAVAGVHDCLSRIVGGCAATAKTVILSAEDLFDMHTAHEPHFEAARIGIGSQLLAHALAGVADTVGIVCYLRRQDHLLAAHYAQFIKGTSAHFPSFGEFRAAFGPRLDAAAILEPWEAAFGPSAVTVAPYEPAMMTGGIVADFFRRALGLAPPPVTTPYPDDLEAFNMTPARDHVEFMRCLNRRSSLGRPVLPREHVLESAFRDRAGGAAGIAAWMSPGERATLLDRYEDGNRRIAANHGMQGGLFREPAPDANNPWNPEPAPGLRRLVELDGMVRAVATALSEERARGRDRRKLRRALWVVSPAATPADEILAAELYGGIAGRPDLESCIRPRFGLRELLGQPSRVALVVFVGPTAGGWTESASLLGLRSAGVRVVRVHDGAIHGPRGLVAQAVQGLPFLLLDELVAG